MQAKYRSTVAQNKREGQYSMELGARGKRVNLRRDRGWGRSEGQAPLLIISQRAQ